MVYLTYESSRRKDNVTALGYPQARGDKVVVHCAPSSGLKYTQKAPRGLQIESG